MANKPNQDALQFLDDLIPPTSTTGKGPPPAASPAQPANPGEAADVLAFIDEITQKSSEPTRTTSHIERPASRASIRSQIERPASRAGTPTLRKSTERVKLGGGPSSSSLAPAAAKTESSAASATKQSEQSAAGGWGWGTVWSSASAAIQQAKSVVDEQVKHLPNNEQARKWTEGMVEYAKHAQLEKLGQDFKRVGLSTLTDILNVVAPPISEHEVIQVWLSHDMRGYEGVETLVYRALARIMEQVEGGDLVVNRGNEIKPKDVPSESGRELHTVEGLEAAMKLAEVELVELAKSDPQRKKNEASSIENPTTYSTVYLRVQPFTTVLALPQSSVNADGSTSSNSEPKDQLQFLLHFSDPAHQLVHSTVTQPIPSHWLELWDQYDWVEDLVAEALRIGVEVIGQEYVAARMGWSKEAEKPNAEEATANTGETTTAA